MPLTLENGDIVEVRVNYVFNSQRLLNVFHYRVADLAEPLDYEAALEYAMAEFVEEAAFWPQVWEGSASDQCEIYKIDAQKIFPVRAYHYQKLVEIPGEVPPSESPPLPQNVQLSLTKVSEATGRGRTGRVEVPGGTTILIEDGRLAVGGVSWLTGLADSLQLPIDLQALSAGQLIPVILYGFAPAGSPDITLVRVQDTVRVSRRRTVGVGE